MIAIDTSALMAVVLGEPEAEACIAALAQAPALLMSAGSVAESLIVGDRRNVGGEIARLIEGLAVEVVPTTEATARRIAAAYARWGKGLHPAGLTFGDCFAYTVPQERGCPLLFVADDFAKGRDG